MNSDHNKRIGYNLRKIRLQKGLMQIDVAVATDLDRTYISKIETGKARITCTLLWQLVKGLEITSIDLIEDRTLTRDIIYDLGGDGSGSKIPQVG